VIRMVAAQRAQACTCKRSSFVPLRKLTCFRPREQSLYTRSRVCLAIIIRKLLIVGTQWRCLYAQKTTHECRERRLSLATYLFFGLASCANHRLQTWTRVSRYTSTATDYGHTNLLLFTHLLRKTSAIDRTKAQGRMGG
jgi:hypothetical protein